MQLDFPGGTESPGHGIPGVRATPLREPAKGDHSVQRLRLRGGEGGPELFTVKPPQAFHAFENGT